MQRHDAKIQELENSLKAIPMKLAATETDLARVEGLLSTERNALGETERYYAEQKGLMTDDEVQVAGAKHKLAQAKNSKEYMAAQREIEQRREGTDLARGRDHEARRGRRCEEEAASVAPADVEALKSVDLEGPRRRQGAHRRDPGEDRPAARRARQAGGRGEAGRAQAYSSIRMRRGLAVVSVRNGTCQGCNMNIPPQLYNTLQRGQTVETCPPATASSLGGDHQGRPASASTTPSPSTGGCVASRRQSAV